MDKVDQSWSPSFKGEEGEIYNEHYHPQRFLPREGSSNPGVGLCELHKKPGLFSKNNIKVFIAIHTWL